MTLDAALGFITRASFVFISLILLVEYARHRDPTRRDALLMFSTFAVAVIIGETTRLLGITNRWLSAVSAFVIMGQPYLLLRLAHWFQQVPAAASRAALAGLAGTAVLLAAAPPPLTPGPTLALVAYFALVEGYAAAVLIRAARRSRGVAHRRLVLVGQASALLMIVILIAGVQAAFPELRPATRPLSSGLTLLTVVLYFLGFTPPARLRRAWQLAELYAFIRGIAGRTAQDRTQTILADLCRTASRTVGAARGSLAALTRPGQSIVAVAASDLPGVAVGDPIEVPGTIGYVPAGQMTGIVRRIADGLGTPWVAAIPIASAEHAWGALVTFLGHMPLFPEDDREALRLMAEQAALVLDLGRLIDEVNASARRLEAANKELEAFSYSVSHDLRAPLRAVDGFTRILAEDVLTDVSPQAREYLDKVRASARQMGLLIDDLLAFSRLSRQPVHRRTVAPASVVDAALDTLHHEQDGRRVEIAVGELPSCEADPALLKQIYVNLLANALKFTRKVSSARIEVGAQFDQGRTVYFVRDNGVGFEMAYASKLFGVFQRLHRAEEYEGTGVGLAIVQRIVHRHGGRAWAEGRPGEGATFYFTMGGHDGDGQQPG